MLIKQLIWDEWNLAHVARHNVTQNEVEEACQSEPVVQKGKKGRLLIYGVTKKGKMVTVVLNPEPEVGVFYPVTARSTSKKEKLIYKKEKGMKNK